MQVRLNKAYADLAAMTNAELAPVGMAWQTTHRIAQNIELLDGTEHPSRAGTYLAAAVLFHAIFPEAAVSSTFSYGLSDDTASLLQQVAAGNESNLTNETKSTHDEEVKGNDPEK